MYCKPSNSNWKGRVSSLSIDQPNSGCDPPFEKGSHDPSSSPTACQAENAEHPGTTMFTRTHMLFLFLCYSPSGSAGESWKIRRYENENEGKGKWFRANPEYINSYNHNHNACVIPIVLHFWFSFFVGFFLFSVFFPSQNQEELHQGSKARDTAWASCHQLPLMAARKPLVCNIRGGGLRRIPPSLTFQISNFQFLIA